MIQLVKYFLSLILSSFFFIVMCQNNTCLPKVEKKKTELIKFNKIRIDNYFWLQQKDLPEVKAYLEAENNYTLAYLKDSKPIEEMIFSEMKHLVEAKKAELSTFKNGYYYYKRYEKGKEYPLYCRNKNSLAENEEIILDANNIAINKGYFKLFSVKVSPDNSILAFSADTTGSQLFTIYFKDLKNNIILSETITNTTGMFYWANDSKTIVYQVYNKEFIPYKIFRYKISESNNNGTLIYEEKDANFYAYLRKSKSDKFIYVISGNLNTTEYHLLDADNPESRLVMVKPRKTGFYYDLYHAEGYFYIRCNPDPENFIIMRTSLDSLSYNAWEVFPRKIKFISSIDKISVFNEFLAIQQRVEGKNVISAINFKSQKYDVIKFPYDSYWADISEENEFKTNSINISFSSIIQPPSLYNYNLQTKSLKMVAQENEDFPTNDYQIKKIYAKSRDGVAIPISYAYKKGQGKNRPVLLYTYGCFGQISDPNFNYIWPSLLKRNINIAIAHVRGGGFLGPKWQNEGRLLKKKNSINDYIHCAEFLIKNNYSNKNIIGFGRSGGGAIVGSAINQEPELFTIAILDVPFVDVLTSQLDESLSLTKNMKSEWGDPNQIEYYNYIFSYSPYDNIKAQTYPALFVTGAYKDVQVPYYIPAKYVAKLRELKIDNKPLLLWTDFNAGHGGETGRYRTYEKYARLLTFICKMLNIKK